MKLKLLLISAIPPFPQTSGGATRMYHTLIELSKKYSIYFITFNSENNNFYKKYTTKYINFELKPKSLFSPIPYRFSDWYSPKLLTYLKDLLTNKKFDLIQIEFTQLLYLSNVLNLYSSNTPISFVAHDISSISFYRRISESKSILKKIAGTIFWLQVYFDEKKYLAKFNKIITVSTTDQQLLQKHFHLPSTVVPNGIDAIHFYSKAPTSYPSKTLHLGYIGSFSHPPNKYAVDYFLNKISPHLTDYQFYLAGNNPKFSHPQVINLGIVKNVINFYSKIDVLIAPIFSGSGTRIKILEALSYGIPVVTTTIGAEGLNIKSSYLQIASNPNEFINCLSHLPSKPSQNLKKQLEPYLWSNIFKIYPQLLTP